MNKNEVKKFLKTHRDIEISAAKLEYTRYLNPELDTKILQVLGDTSVSEEDAKIIDELEKTNDPVLLMKFMRKQISVTNQYHLRQKLLEMEERVTSLIKKRAMTSLQDYFIENVVYYFLHCKENACSWILENYDEFKSEYLKSMLCLVLGFRGDAGAIPFLMDEADRFERLYPEETFDQGPTLAVQELAVKYLNYK